MKHSDTGPHHTGGRTTPSDSDLFIDRLVRLRSILPMLATDLAAARRRANELETRNRRLAERVSELESELTSALHRRPATALLSPQRRAPAGRERAGASGVAGEPATRSESREARGAADAGIRSPRA